jgi:hypothetical protein
MIFLGKFCMVRELKIERKGRFFFIFLRGRDYWIYFRGIFGKYFQGDEIKRCSQVWS